MAAGDDPTVDITYDLAEGSITGTCLCVSLRPREVVEKTDMQKMFMLVSSLVQEATDPVLFTCAICGQRWRETERQMQPQSPATLAVDPDEILDITLDDAERYLLGRGAGEWGGPARCSGEMAVAMGFVNVADLLVQTRRLMAALDAKSALTRRDWLRLLLLTEIVFASNVVGSGLDWSTTTGISDEETIATLRRVQRKLGGIRQLIGDIFGTPAA